MTRPDGSRETGIPWSGRATGPACSVLFEEDTPLQLIQALKPDVLVKGADYRPETAVGAEMVNARGGRVKHVELAVDPGTTGVLSSTALAQRIRASS